MTAETFNLKSRMDQMMSDWTAEERKGFLESLVDGLKLPKIAETAEISSLRSLEDRLRALHLRTDYGYVGGHICDHCGVTYPCETIQILGERS